MKSIITLLTFLTSTAVTAQDTSNVVSSTETKNITAALKNGSAFEPFVKEISFKAEKDNVLRVEIADNAVIAKIDSADAFLKGVEKNRQKATVDKNKNILLFPIDRFMAMTMQKDTIVIRIKMAGGGWKEIGKISSKDADVVTPPVKGGEVKTDYVALAKLLGLELPLKDLFPSGKCCGDSGNPCDSSEQVISASVKLTPNKNKIIYYANTNQTLYYNNNGTLKEVDDKNIEIKAGRPLAFEIRNINPDAFKVEITDTAIAYNVNVDTLLRFLPGVTSGDMIQQANKGLEKYSEQEKARAIFLIAYVNLKDFFLRMQHGCIYEFNKNIYRKITALERLDNYLAKHFPGEANTGLPHLLITKLDTAGSKLDKELFANLLALYNKMPSAYYRMIANVPSAPKNKDKIQFTFNILARENTPYMSLVKNKTIDAYIVHNFRIDVSSGLYYAFNMSNYKHTTRADSIVGRNAANTADSTLKRGSRIVDESSGKGEFGFASFIHFYRRGSANFSWGGHIGAGLNFIDKLKPRYFGGLSFLWGHDDTRVAFNIGVVCGNVDRLSNQYPRANGNYVWLPPGETSLVTRPVFAAQPFVSISYNLPFRNKKKATETVTPKAEDAKPAAAAAKETPPKPAAATTAGPLKQESYKPKKEVTTTTYYK